LTRVHYHPATAFLRNPQTRRIGISWTPRLKSSRNKAPNRLDAAILNLIDCIPPKIPAQKSAPHK